MNAFDKNESITLEILEAIGEGEEVTQRHLANRLGVALGLANSYLKRCIKKGFIKIHQAPANRYLYYLTPTGFAEKSRLTARYLSYSLSFYQKAVHSCDGLFRECRISGIDNILLCGKSELAEIASLRASVAGLVVVEVVESAQRISNAQINRVTGEDGAIVVTDLSDPAGTVETLAARVAVEKLRVPDVLGLGADFLDQISG